MTSYQYYPHQVAGHDTLLLVPGGTGEPALVAKPAQPSEIVFYQQLQAERYNDLRQWLPLFKGTMPMPVQDTHTQAIQQGRQSASFLSPGLSEKANRRSDVCQECILLENLLEGYEKPCVIDIKLGQRLFAADATAEKRRAMEEAARTTTSGSTGLRITGMKVCAVERDIRPLETAIRRHQPQFSRLADYAQPIQGGQGFDKRFGRFLTPASFPFGLSAWLLPAKESTAFKQFLASLIHSLSSLMNALSRHVPNHLQLYSSSLLLAYDAASPSSRSCAKLIDFARSRHVDLPLPDHADETRSAELQRLLEQRDADGGVLFGLKNLVTALQQQDGLYE